MRLTTTQRWWVAIAFVCGVAVGYTWYQLIADFGSNRRDHYIREEPRTAAWIGDVGRFHTAKVSHVYYPHSTSDIQQILSTTSGTVCVRGTSHSMGGQSLCLSGGQLDMRHMNRLLSISVARRLATVEAGMQWSELIRVANLYGLAPMTLQSYSSFSIGGSLSVNAHGVTNDWTVAQSVISFRLVTADGRLRHCSRTQNVELFRAAIGGFGLMGVIVDVTLHLSINEPYTLVSSYHNASELHQLYQTHILNDSSVGVKIARLNFLLDNPHQPTSIHLYLFLRNNNNNLHNISTMWSPDVCECRHVLKRRCEWLLPKAVKSYYRSVLADDASEMSALTRFAYKWIFDLEPVQSGRYWLERQTGKPIDWSSSSKVERNTLLHESAYSLSALDNTIVDLHKTHILQEFFVPAIGPALERWLERFWEIRQKGTSSSSNETASHVTLLNGTIRFVRKDTISMLPYAPIDCYAIVLYYRVSISQEGWQELNFIHRQLAEYAVELGGRFYLPYLHHYSPKLLHQAYPNLNSSFAALKHKYDPHFRFTNLWTHAYKLFPSIPSVTAPPARLTAPPVRLTTPKCDHGADPTKTVALGRVRGWMRELIKKGCLGLHDLELFYRQIFVLVPEDNGAAVAERVRWFLSEGRFLDDSSLYEHLQSYADRRLSWPPLVYRKWRELWALRRQKKEMVHEIARLLRHLGVSTDRPVHNYLSIGDGGRYATVLHDTGLIDGTHLDLHDKTLGYVERHAFESPSHFISRFRSSLSSCSMALPRVQFNEKNAADQVDRALREIPDAYISVAISVVGFHHYMPILDRLLKQLYRIIAPGGLLIIREHDAKPELVPLLHVAHTTFNAFTGIPFEEEIAERRQFMTIECWRQLLATYGFKDTFVSEKQPHDPTHNVLLAFTRS